MAWNWCVCLLLGMRAQLEPWALKVVRSGLGVQDLWCDLGIVVH